MDRGERKPEAGSALQEEVRYRGGRGANSHILIAAYYIILVDAGQSILTDFYTTLTKPSRVSCAI
jgi:hypothetical protein